jgi:hypothetical protein
MPGISTVNTIAKGVYLVDSGLLIDGGECPKELEEQGLDGVVGTFLGSPTYGRGGDWEM